MSAATVLAPTRATVCDVLVRAADLLEEFGWRQGHVGSKRQGVFCALGAINEAQRDLGASKSMNARARRRLADAVGMPVAHWNDAPDRQRGEVVALIRKVARG